MGADLQQATLRQAECSEACFSQAKLSKAIFYKANLTDADLFKADVVGADFRRAILTGACIEEWNANRATNLEGVACDYIYLRDNHQERRPHAGEFKSGEFTQRFHKFLETVDLFFVDGIDWKAFLVSFQDLQAQYKDADLTIQAIERKSGGGFEVRLAISPGADKAGIERDTYQKYEDNLQCLEAQYRAELAAKDDDSQRHRQKNESLTNELLATYRQQNSDLTEIVKLAANRPITVEATAVADNSLGQKDFQADQFSGVYTETARRGQTGGIINNYSAKFDDITRLITSLRERAQSFPTEQKDDVLMELDDIKADIQQPQPDQKRIGRRLKRMAAIATTMRGIPGGDSTCSGNLNNFTGNVIELTETLAIPIELVQPSQTPPAGAPDSC